MVYFRCLFVIIVQVLFICGTRNLCYILLFMLLFIQLYLQDDKKAAGAIKDGESWDEKIKKVNNFVQKCIMPKHWSHKPDPHA